MGVFVISISDSWGAIRESLKKPQKIGHLDTLEALAFKPLTNFTREESSFIVILLGKPAQMGPGTGISRL